MLKIQKALLAVLPAAVIVLELLPYGAVLHFANGFGGTIRETFSYFSFIPFGYANFGPLCTAVLSCLLLGLAAVYLLSGKGRPILRIVSVAAFAVSLTPLLLSLSSFSVCGGAISVLLGAEALLLFAPWGRAR